MQSLSEGLANLQAVSQIGFGRRQGQWQPSTERQSDPYGSPAICVEDNSPIASVGRQENIVAAHNAAKRHSPA